MVTQFEFESQVTTKKTQTDYLYNGEPCIYIEYRGTTQLSGPITCQFAELFCTDSLSDVLHTRFVSVQQQVSSSCPAAAVKQNPRASMTRSTRTSVRGRCKCFIAFWSVTPGTVYFIVVLKVMCHFATSIQPTLNIFSQEGNFYFHLWAQFKFNFDLKQRYFHHWIILSSMYFFHHRHLLQAI